MTAWWRSLLLGLAAIATVAAAPAAARRPGAAPAIADTPQILVMLTIVAPHYRPGGNYGGGYGDDIDRTARRRLAAKIARRHGLVLRDNWPMPLLSVDCFVMAVPAGRTTDAAAAEVSRDPGVAWSQPMAAFHALAAPAGTTDPLAPVQPATRAWRMADLHQIATGRGVTVAVIDSRIEANHPDLRGQISSSENFVDGHGLAAERHGTGVAGIIAAIAGNGVGIAGVAPAAHLMALRACWQDDTPHHASVTVCDTLSLAKALHFAIEHGVGIVNMSLAGPADLLLAKLLQVGIARGMVVVAAFDRQLPHGGFPASEPGVIAVADAPLPVSTTGVYVAPGTDVPTTQPGGLWYLVNGSSYAAAHVSGLVALVRERAPSRRTAPYFVSSLRGGGAIDACATLVHVTGSCDCACAAPATAPGGHR